ncbi:MAG: hypothetical protein ACYCZO_15075, partial [Daejeonella sp.]
MQQNYKGGVGNFRAQAAYFQIKALQLLFVCLIFLSACGQKRLPDGIIDETRMVRIMADLHTIDGYMSSLMSTDTLRMAGKNYYAA